MDALLTTEEVAEVLRVEVVTVRRLVARGELAAYRLGGEYRFKARDIEDYLDRQRIPTGTGLGGDDRDTFTERTRRVLAFAQEEAARLNRVLVGPEHVLLGLLRDEGNVAAKIVRSMGVDLAAARRVVDHLATGWQETSPASEEDRGLTRPAKELIARAQEEARRLDHAYLGPEHLLLALTREGDDRGAGLLTTVGVDPEQVRHHVTRTVTQSNSA